MAVRRFAISMSLIIHHHSERSINVDECVWESNNRFEHGVSPIIHML
jgi:hypothetical protein